MRREWVRVAGVAGAALNFTLQKRAISCEYDETMAVDHAEPKQLDEYAQKALEERRPLAAIVREVVPELIKLNPAGTVHAKSIYSAVSVACRCAPAAVFAILSTQPIYVNAGAGMWAFDESREKR
jgi:hypothetical protein